MSSELRRMKAPDAQAHGANASSRPFKATGNLSSLAQTMQSHVDELRAHLLCGICIRPLYEPFTIACGHTFCYSCLSAWFDSKKTCPDCRSSVKVQPAPAYLIRTLVHTFTSCQEFLEAGETTEDHWKYRNEEAQRVEKDKSNTNPQSGGLFNGKFKSNSSTQRPILDIEDNVLRCPQCSWELEEDDGCIRCGYHPDDASVTSTEIGAEESDLDGNLEMTDYYDDEAEDGFDEADDFSWDTFGAPAATLPSNLNSHLYDLPNQFDLLGYHLDRLPRLAPSSTVHRPPARHVISDDDEDEDEDDDEDDMDSFIDDDINSGQGYGTESDHSTIPGNREQSTESLDDDSQLDSEAAMSDDDCDSLEEGASESEADEDSDGDHILPQSNSRTLRQNNCVPGNSRPTHSSSYFCGDQLPSAGISVLARTTINIDDDSDEGPVGPVRRIRNGKSGRISSY